MPECNREELELHARFVSKPLMMDAQTVDAIRRMALRTLNGSAIQARLRSASSTGVPDNGMASRRSFSRSTALFKSSSRGNWHRLISRVVKSGASFVTHLCSGFQQEMQHTRHDLPLLQQKLARERPSNSDSPHPAL